MLRPVNPCGVTPMTVNGTPVRRISRPDDRGVGAELLGPRLVREHDHSIAAGDAILIGNERSPHDRLDAKNVEEICADCESERALRGIVALRGKARVSRSVLPARP